MRTLFGGNHGGVVGGDNDDDDGGDMMVLTMGGWCDGGLWWGGGGYRRVAARGGGDRVDRVMGRLLGLGRKTRRKSFSAATMAVVSGIRPVVVAGEFGR
ncbi:hypothetical protein Tco_1442296 [Tanacetum coccineum]